MKKDVQELRELIGKRKTSLFVRNFIIFAFLFGAVSASVKIMTTDPACRISTLQRTALNERINRIAKGGKISKSELYKHLKGKFRYETLRKIPCKQYDDVLDHLNEIEKSFN